MKKGRAKMLVIGVFIIALVSFIISRKCKIEIPPETAVVEEEVVVTSISVLESIDLLNSRFNTYAESTPSKIRFTNENIFIGQYFNSCSNNITHYIIIVSRVNKADNSIQDITILTEDDGTNKSLMDRLTVFTGVITAIKPEMTNDERTHILRSLKVLENNIPQTYRSSSIVKDGIEFSASYIGSKGGILFEIKPV